MFPPFTAECPSAWGWPQQWPHMVLLRHCSSHGPGRLPWASSCPDTLPSCCFPPVSLAVSWERDMDHLFSASPSSGNVWLVMDLHQPQTCPNVPCEPMLFSSNGLLLGISSHVSQDLTLCESEAQLLMAPRLRQ